MKYIANGTIPSAPGPAEWFTGTVFIDGVRQADEVSPTGCAHVRFTPGARTAWHTHPKGQTLYITDGVGYVAVKGKKPQMIKPGDIIQIEAGEEHWHGATENRFMSHVALQDADETGAPVTWLKHVTDEEYGQAS